MTDAITTTVAVLDEIREERTRQDARWGEQNWPDGTGTEKDATISRLTRQLCDAAHRAGDVTWRHILLEEVYEATAEEDLVALRAELVQVAAVAVNWIEAIDRRVE